MSSTDRKACYKVHPSDLWSQDARRTKALEEQKRRRAQKFGSVIDSSRQLDLFAKLTLGPSDDEEGDQDDTEILHEGVGTFTPLLEPPRPSFSDHCPALQEPENGKLKEGKKKRHKRKGRRGEGGGSKPNKYADKCMYAELLEMNSDEVGTSSLAVDGLPMDLESAWVAVAPVPIGKRCLAVTHQSSGIAGVVPNTTLRSRVLGKSLIPPFPSSLPPSTILDCIIDHNWRDNGVLHVLDVLKWKGQDIGDCETPFRFWWRDTRLAELPPSPPPSRSAPRPPPRPGSPPTNIPQSTTLSSLVISDQQQKYRFPYPATFLPIPYHTNTTLPVLSSHVIPLARSTQQVIVDIPTAIMPSPPDPSSGMDIDVTVVMPTTLSSISFDIHSDGLLLYVAQASYEPGTSPLSTWIPIKSYDTAGTSHNHRHNSPMEGPLDLFELLVKRRISTIGSGSSLRFDVIMDTEMEGS